MIHNLNIESKAGKEFMDLLGSLHIGDVMELPTPLPGLCDEKTTAILQGCTPGHKWSFSLQFLGVEYAQGSVVVAAKDLSFSIRE